MVKRILISILLGLLVYFVADTILSKFNLSSSNESIKVFFKVKLKKEDRFRLFYKRFNADKHQGNISYNVYPEASKYEIVVFEIPSNEIVFLRVDLGFNPLNDSIEIKDFHIKFDDRILRIDDLEKAFYPNSNATILGNVVTTNSTKINGKTNYFPIMNAKKETIKSIQEIVNKPLRIPYYSLISILIGLTTFVYFFSESKPYIYAKKYQLGITLIFCSVIYIPLILTLFGISYNSNLENRNLIKKPKFILADLDKYPSSFTKYFNGNFPFRSILIEIESKLKYSLFNSVIDPEKTLVGKDGWIFISKSFNIYPSYTRSNLLKSEELKAFVQKRINIKKGLNKKGVKYFHTFYPNKHTIQDNYLPSRYRIQQADTVSKVDQVINYIDQNNLDYEIIDVRPVLRAVKDSMQIYRKADTHWNELGAFVAYKHIFERISQKEGRIKPLDYDDIEIRWKESGIGGNVNLLGIRDTSYVKDVVPIINTPIAKNEFEIRKIDSKNHAGKSDIYINKNIRGNLVAVIYHDSFTKAMKKYIAQHFRKTVFIWNHYEGKYVEIHKPDIVLVGYCERVFK